jgi:hypothetical protein
VFFAIDQDFQGQGFGKRLMQILKGTYFIMQNFLISNQFNKFSHSPMTLPEFSSKSKAFPKISLFNDPSGKVS